MHDADFYTALTDIFTVYNFHVYQYYKSATFFIYRCADEFCELVLFVYRFFFYTDLYSP